MKRSLTFLLALLALSGLLCGCARTVQIDDLSRTSYIEVRAFSNTDQSYTDYVISDYREVDEVCATLQSLTLEKVRITEPLGMACQLTFYDLAHRRIDSMLVVFGNYVDYNGDLHKITSDCDVVAYLNGIVAKLTPVSPEGGTQ